LASSLLSKAALSVTDIFEALDATSSMSSSHEMVPSSTELSLPGLENRGLKNRSDTPMRRTRLEFKQPRPASMEVPTAAPKPAVSFATPGEWLQHSKNKTELVEQIYKRPGWRHLLQVTGSADLRKKLSKLSREELAQVIVKLDHS
jgi:hypothetical protein